jgi:hypothetical protein
MLQRLGPFETPRIETVAQEQAVGKPCWIG